MADIKKIGFAVLGCGHAGARHARVVNASDGAKLTALADILPREELGLKEFSTAFYSSLDEMLASATDTDAVIIATPNYLHAAHSIKCMEAGKHVVIEKPLALTTSDANAILSKSKDTGKQVFVVMQNRYAPPIRWLKELVTSGDLGNIYLAQLSCFWNRDQRYYQPGSWHGKKEKDGGTLFTQFSHFIDILYWLFGDIKNINARTRNFGHAAMTDFEDSGVVQFDFANGGIGSLSFSTCVWDKNMESSLTVIAENGSIRIGGQYMNRIDHCHVKDVPVNSLPISANDNSTYVQQNQEVLLQHILWQLQGRAANTIKGEDGLKVVEIIERMYQTREY